MFEQVLGHVLLFLNRPPPFGLLREDLATLRIPAPLELVRSS